MKYYSAICLNGLKKNTKDLRVVGIPVEIRTVDLLNANREHYHFARLDQYVSHFDGQCDGKFAEEMKRRKINRSIVDPAVSSPLCRHVTVGLQRQNKNRFPLKLSSEGLQKEILNAHTILAVSTPAGSRLKHRSSL